MTQSEKIESAANFLAGAVPAGLIVAFLIGLAWGAVCDLVDVSGRTAKIGALLLVVVAICWTLFCASTLFYLRVYLPLHGVA